MQQDRGGLLQNGLELLDDRRPLEMVCDQLRRFRLAPVERIDTSIPIRVVVVRIDDDLAIKELRCKLRTAL